MTTVRRRDLPDRVADYDRELLETLCEDLGWNSGDIAVEVHDDRDAVKARLDALGIEGDPTRISQEPAATIWKSDPEDYGLDGGESA